MPTPMSTPAPHRPRGRVATAATRAAALVLASALLADTARAQSAEAAVACEVADFSVVLRLWMPLVQDGSRAPAPAGMQGSLELHHSKVPRDRRVWSLDGKRPQQFWNHGDEMRLLLLLGDSEARISLVIETVRRDFGRHVGSFRLETPEVKLSGRLACTVD